MLARQQLQRWAWERVGHGKLLLRCRLLGGARRFGAHGGGERGEAYCGGRPPTACSKHHSNGGNHFYPDAMIYIHTEQLGL